MFFFREEMNGGCDNAERPSGFSQSAGDVDICMGELLDNSRRQIQTRCPSALPDW